MVFPRVLEVSEIPGERPWAETTPVVQLPSNDFYQGLGRQHMIGKCPPHPHVVT